MNLSAALFILIFSVIDCGAAWPARIFAPHVYLGADDGFQIMACDKICGQKFYTIAFIVADKMKNPAWDGLSTTNKSFYLDQIEEIRRHDGDVIVSFGGADGKELATIEHNPVKLEAEYQSLIDQYKLTWLDFDIEGSALADASANRRRNAVLARVQRKNPGLIVSYTLPVDPKGIPRSARKLLADAKAKGLRVYSANVMTMDFGSRFSKGKKMSDVSIASALKAHEQCQKIDPEIRIGLTPMIGKNDEKGEVFTLGDARVLTNWAEAQSWVCSLSFWASNRDASRPGKKQDDNTTSGIDQQPWAFTRIFKSFTTEL
jgi:hypothetical protein